MKICRLLLLAGMVGVLLAGAVGFPLPAILAQDTPQSPLVDAVQMVVSAREDIPAFQYYDQRVSEIFLSEDGALAVIWLASYDRQTGEALGTEPGVVLAQRDLAADGAGDENWSVLLPFESGWQDLIASLPESLMVYIPEELINPDIAPEEPYATFGGYYLPWAGGLTKYLSWAANHLSCPEKCLHAVDFYDGEMFPLLAAKGGTVFGYKDTCNNGATDCTNYIALEDRSTSPYTYQIYLHLANGTIPSALKNLGAAVLQGEFIGNVDDTGYSEGHHLHFMVVTNPYFYPTGGYWWGFSADITYKDVFINWDDATQGGRPCTAVDVSLNYKFPWCQESQFAYVSGNQGANPPRGGLTAPANKIYLHSNTLTVSGWGQDDLGVSELQVIARYDGVWRNIGDPQHSTPFTTAINLCDAGVPDGAVDIGLRVWDEEGNQVMPLNVRHLLVDTTCPPAPPPAPGCLPGADQIALYSQPNFGGSCTRLGIDVYPTAASFGSIGDNSVASIKVGDNVKLVAYDGANLEQRQETFGLDDGKDRNLADNRIGSLRISSAFVDLRSAAPSNPELYTPRGTSGSAPTSVDSLILSWEGGDGATKFQAELYQNSISGSPLRTRAWSTDTFWSLGSLPVGVYAWRVQARISEKSGTQHYSAWVSGSFTVSSASLPALSQVTAPFIDTLQTAGSWTPTGLWAWRTDPDDNANKAFAFNNGTDYADPNIGSGDLTSRPILIPAAGYYLRFDSYYDTEGAGSDWDQRRVQISANSGPFTDLYQFSEDRMGAWLHSPPLSLSAYAGQVVRLRFHFDIVDRFSNAGHLGWLVDNIHIVNSPAIPACADAGNDLSGGATTIAFGQTFDGSICPAGDTDYFKVAAARGDRILVDINAASLTPGSPLDAVLDIAYQGDTGSLLAVSDDESPQSRDPFMVFYVEEAGTYYLRLRSYDHPGDGGAAHAYTIRVANVGGTGGTDTSEPSVSLTSPAGGWLAGGAAKLSANAVDNDGGSGISRVEYYWHSNDWNTGKWEYIGTDWDAVGGWSINWDTSGFAANTLISVYARAVDWAGNSRLHVNWVVRFDDAPPVVSLDPLAGSQTETPVRLTWSGSDTYSGLSRYLLEVNRDNIGWAALSSSISPSTLSWWYVGTFGHSYQFRLRAYDIAGNLSSPSQASVTLAPTCQGDAFESDNTLSTAKILALLTYQEHSFCATGDVDWIRFTPQAGHTYLLWAVASPGSAATPALELFATDGTTLLAADSTTQFGGLAMIEWTAPSSAGYYLRVKSSDQRVAGTYIQYQVWVGPGYPVYLPTISR